MWYKELNETNLTYYHLQVRRNGKIFIEYDFQECDEWKPRVIGTIFSKKVNIKFYNLYEIFKIYKHILNNLDKKYIILKDSDLLGTLNGHYIFPFICNTDMLNLFEKFFIEQKHYFEYDWKVE